MNREKQQVVKPIKISERLIYLIIIVGLIGFVIYFASSSSNFERENSVALQKNEVLNSYTQSLDKIIREKENKLSLLTQADQEQKVQIRTQITQLKQKQQEIQQLKQARQIDFQKLIKISAELEQMHQKDEILRVRFVSLNDSVKQPTGVDKQTHQQLQSEYDKLKVALEQALEKNTALSGRLYATHFVVTPGEIRRSRFSASTRARRTTHLRVGFTLTRPLKPSESIAVDVHHPEGVFPVIQVYNNELKIQPNNRVTMNLTSVNGRKFKRGNNTLNIYRMYNGTKTKVGSHVVYLR